MPAWTESASRAGLYLGVKVVNVFPGNSARGLPAVAGLYVLQSGRTGETLAAIDGTRLTHWRTAAASALAARSLARADAQRLLVVGAGALAPFLARAHASVRAYERIAIWNRQPGAARALALRLAGAGLPAEAVEDLETAVGEADVVSCATLAAEPLIAGRWLKAGQHLDLVGRVQPDHARGGRRGAAPLAHLRRHGRGARRRGRRRARHSRGAIDRSAVIADLPALCRGAPGRTGADEITLFKSVGAAVEDLAAAILVWKCRRRRAIGPLATCPATAKVGTTPFPARSGATFGARRQGAPAQRVPRERSGRLICRAGRALEGRAPAFEESRGAPAQCERRIESMWRRLLAVVLLLVPPAGAGRGQGDGRALAPKASCWSSTTRATSLWRRTPTSPSCRRR